MDDLATLQDVAAELGGTEDPTDVRMVHALERASGMVRSYTGQVFSLVEDDEVYLDGSGSDALQLPQLAAYEPLTIEHLAADDTVLALPPTFAYRLDRPSGLLYRTDGTPTYYYSYPIVPASWDLGRMRWHVTYSHGYLLPGQTYTGTLDPLELPAIVRGTTASIAAMLYALNVAGRTTQEGIGNYSVRFQPATRDEFDAELKGLVNFRVVDAA